MLAGLTKRPLQVLYQSLWQAADWVYPPSCGGCGKFGRRWCADCQAETQTISSELCTRCGTPLPQRGVCTACRVAPPPFTALRSWAIYKGPLRQAIHAFKYHGDLGLTETFSLRLVNIVILEKWPVDLVTCVPLSPQRMAERGYNQSSLLAQPVAFGLSIPFSPHLVERKRDTVSQVKLSRSERIENMRNAFQADPKRTRGRAILLIDDVTTTGATMLGCTQALLDAGARYVFGLTLARALAHDDPASLPLDAPA